MIKHQNTTTRITMMSWDHDVSSGGWVPGDRIGSAAAVGCYMVGMSIDSSSYYECSSSFLD